MKLEKSSLIFHATLKKWFDWNMQSQKSLLGFVNIKESLSVVDW